MRKTIAAIALCVAVGSIPAGADHEGEDWTATGEILLPNPATREAGGLTELLSPCGGSFDPDVPDGLAQGLDGYWIELPEGSAGHIATLVGSEGADVDAWFYTAGCQYIATDAGGGAIMATDGDEEGVIPPTAHWVAVDLYLGFDASFTFTILDDLPPDEEEDEEEAEA